MTGRLLLSCFFAVAISGCEPGFTPASKVENLRVLAVRPEPASGAPGTVVALDLLHTDPRDGARAPEIAWLGGCHNPPARQYYECLPLLGQAAGVPGNLGFGARFEFAVPDDILSSAQRVPTDPVHFGVSYVFFAVCAGSLRLRPDVTDRLPLDCADVETGEPLGPQDLVIGFSTIYSYEGAQNQNPLLTELSFDGVPGGSIGPDGVPVEPACAQSEDCTSDGGRDRVCSLGRCLPVVPSCSGSGCPEYRLAPAVAPATLEPVPGGNEIVWANYYATAGDIVKATQLVIDRRRGFIDDYTSSWRAPGAAAGAVRFWVTVNDQRGGATWGTLDVFVR
jgi:hypothetical protein